MIFATPVKPAEYDSKTREYVFSRAFSCVSTSYPFLKHKPDLAVVIVTEITAHSRLLSAK